MYCTEDYVAQGWVDLSLLRSPSRHGHRRMPPRRHSKSVMGFAWKVPGRMAKVLHVGEIQCWHCSSIRNRIGADVPRAVCVIDDLMTWKNFRVLLPRAFCCFRSSVSVPLANCSVGWKVSTSRKREQRSLHSFLPLVFARVRIFSLL